MSGSLHDVKNDVWMRAVIVSVLLLVVGGVAYGAFAIGVGSVKQNDWDAADNELKDAKAEWNIANESGTVPEQEAANDAYKLAEEAEEDAHLSYLTWITAGKTILVMMIVYAAFYGIAGFYNSIQPEEEHDDHHGDDHEEHHGSASPILMAGGIMLFMMGFPGFVNTCKSMLGLEYQAEMGDFSLAVVGLAITIIGTFGMLLPLMGFDAHPRPEAWGWRLCLSLSPMILTFQTDLASEIILGVIFAILISITSPLVIEKRHKKLAN